MVMGGTVEKYNRENDELEILTEIRSYVRGVSQGVNEANDAATARAFT